MVPMPETIALIKYLKEIGIKIYGLTNMPKEILDHLINTYEVFKDFSGITSSSYAGLAKPEGEIYQRLLDDNKIIPDQTVFLDDREENLVEAKRKGIQVVLFDDIDRVKSELNITTRSNFSPM